MTTVQRQKTSHLRDEEWESRKDIIRIKYLDENKTHDQILAELKLLGFVVTKSQLEIKLKKWKFHKNLRPDAWRYIRNILQVREASSKKSLVILSGRRISFAKVKKETKRNELVRYGIPALCAKDPPKDIPLYICTPRGSSTDLIFETPWPDTLPWNQCSKSLMMDLFKGTWLYVPHAKIVTCNIPDSQVAYSVSQVASQGHMTLSSGQTSLLFSIAFEHIVKRSLSIMIGSEPLAIELFAKKSIDKIAARFDAIIPESNEDQNLHRAAIMISGRQSEVLTETIKIIIFLISNRLLMDDSTDNGYTPFLEDRQVFISLCRLSGLAQPLVLRRLVGLSWRSPTLTAVVDAMFDAAVHVQAADIVSTLLSLDGRRIRADRPIARLKYSFSRFVSLNITTPLDFAVVHDSLDLAAALLDAGASIQADHERSLLSLAILCSSKPSSSSKLVQLLMQRGLSREASYNRKGISALQAAIMRGDRNLIEVLVKAGSAVNFRSRTVWELFIQKERDTLSSWWTMLPSVCDVFLRLEDVGCLGYAASFKSGLFAAKSESLINEPCYKEEDQEALDLCVWTLSKYGSQMDLSPAMTTDAMILAAARNYTRVISFLYESISAPINSRNGTLSPIYTAVCYGQVDACRLLLELGASLDTLSFEEESTLPIYASRPVPSLIHLAVDRGDSDILSLLIQYGACVDQSSAFPCHKHGFESRLAWPPDRYDDFVVICETPFRLALRQRHLNAALLLLNHGATATSYDLFIAAKDGHLDLVRHLVGQGIHPSKAMKDGTSAFQAALSNGHTSVAIFLSGAGADSDFAAMFRLLEVTSVQAIIPSRILAHPRDLVPGLDGRSYLENAILGANENVIEFALSLDTTFYDSGSLCAVVFTSARRTLPSASIVLKELLRRRDGIPRVSGYNPTLENTALSIATFPGSSSLFTILIAHLTSDMIGQLAVVPRLISNQPFRTENVVDTDWALMGYSKKQQPFIPSGSDQWHTSPHKEVSPLLFAVRWRNIDAVHSLLASGYKPDGFTLRTAIMEDLPFLVVEKIINSCEDIDARCAVGSLSSHRLRTPLCIAVQRGHLEIVRSLLDHHADINCIGRMVGWRKWSKVSSTALKEAVRVNSLDLVCLLLDRGANVETPIWSPKQPFETTALQIAAGHGYIGIVKALLARGADVNARRNIFSGHTALEAAAAYGRLDIVRLLLDFGAETEGFGRVQYVRAVMQATREGFAAIGDLLKSHRDWTAEDEIIKNELRYLSAGFLHEKEHSTFELIEVLAELNKRPFEWSWDGGKVVWRIEDNGLKWGLVAFEEAHKWLVTYKVTDPAAAYERLDDAATVAWQTMQKFAQDLWTESCPRYDDNTKSQNVSSDSQSSLSSYYESISQQAKMTVLEALEGWKLSCDATTSNQESQESDMSAGPTNIDLESWIAGTSNRETGNPDGVDFSLIDRQNDPERADMPDFGTDLLRIEDDDNRGDEHRKLVLMDMLGEAEAPFIPMDFSL